ncbi:hypothetical protein MSG28_016175 [Choristoneura fumiferana]|uniref:Uncharacterized protein n=1 Tax=Choristoneura fumiferana TaxID=7141 RepID=A0ACC0K5M9_CHOFU|nr:hypothetical protein MSG28_016175 [Choristoneura fumiferana]
MNFQIIILLAIDSSLAAQDYPKFYCGRRLARAIAVLCSADYVKTEQYPPPWLLEKPHALTGSRGKRQIVSECCEKACTREVLMTYCSN